MENMNGQPWLIGNGGIVGIFRLETVRFGIHVVHPWSRSWDPNVALSQRRDDCKRCRGERGKPTAHWQAMSFSAPSARSAYSVTSSRLIELPPPLLHHCGFEQFVQVNQIKTQTAAADGALGDPDFAFDIE